MLLIPIVANADTSQNLITNGTFEDNNLNGWTTSGDVQVIGDCCGSQYDVEFGDSGYIEQNFKLYSDTITQPMLDNGITLNSSVLMQNGEGGAGGWAPNRGGADSFSIRLQIKDSQSNVLSETTQTRTTTTGINGEIFTDSVSYTGIGSNNGNIRISGTDANAPAYLGGPNVDNVSVTMEYAPIVLSLEQTQEIAEIFEEIEEVFAQEQFSQIEELVFEEIFIEPMVEEIYIEAIEEIVEINLEEEFIEETIVLAPEVIEEEIVMVEPEVVMEESVEVIEEVFEEVIAEAPIEETITEETVTEETVVEETVVEESIVNESPEEVETSTDQEEVNTPVITVQDISVKVAEKIRGIDAQLQATSIIVAKVMQKNNIEINKYATVNNDIFKQPDIQDINIDSYLNSNYLDIRNIYPNQIYEDRLWTSRQ